MTRAITCLMIATMALSAWTASTVSVRKLRITTQIPGLKEKPGAFRAFAPKDLYEIIDGGATVYLDHGLHGGIHQELDGGDGRSIEIFAEDFGAAPKAREMLAAKRRELTEVLPLDGEDTAQVAASRAIGALLVFASIDRFYVELTITGYPAAAEAQAVATTLLGRYRATVGK